MPVWLVIGVGAVPAAIALACVIWWPGVTVDPDPWDELTEEDRRFLRWWAKGAK